MSIYDNFFENYMSDLDKKIPKTIEEAEESIKSDVDQYSRIQIAANINTLAQLLINKGIITEEEYTIWYNASEKNILRKAAEEIIKVVNGED